MPPSLRGCVAHTGTQSLADIHTVLNYTTREEQKRAGLLERHESPACHQTSAASPPGQSDHGCRFGLQQTASRSLG
jgi:hypothetical protein